MLLPTFVDSDSDVGIYLQDEILQTEGMINGGRAIRVR